MSKKLKPSRYQSEYNSSYRWNKSHQIENLHNNSMISLPIRSDRSANSERDLQQKYRHKLKQSLLEKLQDLEAEMSHENHKKSSYRQHHKSSRRKIPPEKKDEKSHVIKDEWHRSRSVAAEIKLRNESSQIWWLQEPFYMDNSDSEYSSSIRSYSSKYDELSISHDNSIKHTNNNYSTWQRNSRPKLKQPIKMFNQQNKPMKIHNNLSTNHKSMMSPISTADRSHSTFSKSSLSGQIAQATGYQSTTDELSSFNHDTDTRSTNGVHSNSSPNNHRLDSIQLDRRKHSITKSIDIPVLNIPNFSQMELSTNSSSYFEQTPIDPSQLITPNNDDDSNKPLTCSYSISFCTPYQKEDFSKDTTSESLEEPIANPNPDTFRLDK